ncbi:MAG: hypothetical protein ACPGYK_08850 [Flavobacteriales bacterium]
MTLKNNDLTPDNPDKDHRPKVDFNFTTVMENVLGAFSLERGLLPTMRDLLLNPKQVMDSYFQGDKRYLGPGRWLSFCLTVMGLCYLLGGKWEIEGAWKEEEIERMAKIVGGREVIEKWETNVIEILETLMGNPSILLATCLLPLVFSFKLMFRRAGQNFAQHVIIQLYCLGLVLVLTSLPNLFWMGQEFRIECLADSAVRGYPEIHPRGSYSAYSYFCISLMSGYFVWANRSIFGGTTFSVFLRTLIAIALTSVFFTLALSAAIVVM